MSVLDDEPRNADGQTPLHEAVMAGNLEEVRKLVSSGANINALYVDEATPDEGTALLLAVKNDDYDTVAYLLENGANIEAQDVNGLTALHLAVVADRKDITEILLGKGANIKAIDNSGRTTLHWASLATDDRQLGLLLIDHGAEVNAMNLVGETPLHEAVTFGNVGAVQVLLEHGVDKTIQAEDGMTALNRAQAEGHEAIVELLK